MIRNCGYAGVVLLPPGVNPTAVNKYIYNCRFLQRAVRLSHVFIVSYFERLANLDFHSTYTRVNKNPSASLTPGKVNEV